MGIIWEKDPGDLKGLYLAYKSAVLLLLLALVAYFSCLTFRSEVFLCMDFLIGNGNRIQEILNCECWNKLFHNLKCLASCKMYLTGLCWGEQEEWWWNYLQRGNLGAMNGPHQDKNNFVPDLSVLTARWENCGEFGFLPTPLKQYWIEKIRWGQEENQSRISWYASIPFSFYVTLDRNILHPFPNLTCQGGGAGEKGGGGQHPSVEGRGKFIKKISGILTSFLIQDTGTRKILI